MTKDSIEPEDDSEKVPYPFEHKIPWPWYRRVQLVIACFSLIPLRLIALALTLPVSLLIAQILRATRDEGERRSFVFSKWYQLFLVKVFLLLAKFQFFILGISLNYTGEPAPRNEAPVLVLAPHSTIVECVFGHYHEMISGSPASPVVQDGIRDLPLVGALLEICNPIYVNRGNPKSRSDTVHEINKRVNVEQPFPQVAIFPEGTCSNAQALLTFKIGAFIPRVPLQPVWISLNCWNTISWTLFGPRLPSIVFFTLAQLRIQLCFNYLPVEAPLENEDPFSFAERIRVKIGKSTGLKLTQLCYENGVIDSECVRIGLPRETILENAEKLMKAHKLKTEDIFIRLQEFKSLRNQKTNRIDLESLKRAAAGKTHSEKEYFGRLTKLVEDNEGKLDAASFIKNHPKTLADLEDRIQSRQRFSTSDFYF